MEEDFGLNALSEVERNVLYAIKDLEQENGAAKTGQLLDHEFTSKISRISVFRSIKKLEKEKKIKKRGAKRGEYITTSSNRILWFLNGQVVYRIFSSVYRLRCCLYVYSGLYISLTKNSFSRKPFNSLTTISSSWSPSSSIFSFRFKGSDLSYTSSLCNVVHFSSRD